MGKTNIEYADEVSNPLRAINLSTGKAGTFCEKPDPEGTCKHCWAEALNKRFGNGLAFDRSNRHLISWEVREKEVARLERLNARKPMSTKFPGEPLVVFANDTYDIFQPSIPYEFCDRVFDHFDKLTNLTLLIQTTYVSWMSRYLTRRYPDGMPAHYFVGMSAGTQPFFHNNIRHLQTIPATRRYVIFEPLLEHPAIPKVWLKGISMVIVGGESGTQRREFKPEWARYVKERCEISGTAFFMKQIDKVKEIPADLMIREFPNKPMEAVA